MQRLGPYALVRRIAAGGMAEVWMGRRRAMGGASKTVAIKLLASHLASNPVYRRMFVDEARLTMMLTHSNIVQVFDVGEQAGRSYLVMEWIDGLDLSRLAASMRERGEAFEFGVVAHVVGELLRALAYAHGLSEGEGEASTTIVHRDISPHNVLISVSGEVKLSDFGVARLASEETSGLHVRGKLRYMPPEQVRGQSKHATLDLFAVGALMQELLDGVRFRAGLERDELFGMVIRGEVPDLARADVPAELRTLRDALLAPEVKDRVQSAGEALALLGRYPGYRNAADELASLVRGRAGVSGPRTGLTVEFSGEELERSDEPTTREGSAGWEGSELATRTIQSAEEAGSETTPHTALAADSRATGRRQPRLPAIVGLALASLGAVIGFGYAWLHEPPTTAAAPSHPAVAVAKPTPEAPAAIEAPAAMSERESEVVEVADASEGADRGEVTDASPTAQPRAELDAEPATAPDNAKNKRPAKVEFAAHEFFFVWVKVNGRALALEPTAVLDLKPGRHKVWLREGADQAWSSAGRIEVEAGRHYRVSLRRPHGLKLEAVGP